MEYSIKQISEMLTHRVEDVARHLLPGGKKVANEYKIGDIYGKPGESLSIRISGDKAGVWSDFAEGTSGDLIDLWRTVRQLSLKEALKEIKQWLGINGSPTFYSSHSKQFRKPELKNTTKVKANTQVNGYLVNERKLTPETISAFKIESTHNEIVFPYYRDDRLLQIKYLNIYRSQGKKQIRVEANCEPCLFGWQAIDQNTRYIVLTEGEIDAMTLHQYGYPALSLPFGGGSGEKHKWIEYEYDRLSIYDDIYLCFDQDKVGEETTRYLTDRLGSHRCKIVRLPYKDANECLQQDVSQEVISSCFEQARTIDPQELKPASSFVEQVINDFYPTDSFSIGINPPWEKCLGKIRFRPCELSIWTGINGHGKSQLLGHVLLHAMQQGKKICVASLELKPQRLLMRLTRQAAGLQDPSPEYIRAIHEWYDGKLWIFDLAGTAKASRLLEVFTYARKRYGIDIFVIDSFMKCGIGEDDYTTQKQFVEELCDFKNQHNCHIHLVIHPRKLSDESSPPGKLDMKGTGAVSDLADNCFVVWRNKRKEDKVRELKIKNLPIEDELLEQYDCLLCCDKQRNGDWEGKIALWFDPASYQYLNRFNQKPVQYIEYSNRG